MSTLISHEIPKALFIAHDEINDYPYLLAHLLSDKYNYDREYAMFYKECVKRFKYSYLDNSCYELGYPVETEIIVELANEYKVSHVVIPDSYRDCDQTIRLGEINLPKLIGKTDSKLFAVLQGRSMDEMLRCYDFFSSISEIDIIGINFMELSLSNSNRKEFIEYLLKVRRVEKKLHFLGVRSPYELLKYPSSILQAIHSIDTSNPIMCGLMGYKYRDQEDVLYEKPIAKLAENLDVNISMEQKLLIKHNIFKFKQFISR